MSASANGVGFWPLDPGVIFLNHGSFGSCPRPVLECQREWRDRLERQPVQFLVRELEPLIDAAREELARFVGGAAEDLVFVPCATAGINTVLRSLEFEAGDELLVSDHEYNASRNALEFVAHGSGAKVVVARIPFPLRRVEEVIESVMAAVTERTKLLLIDHVTSQTGLVFPIERLVPLLEARGVSCLVDGAHAPGMVPLRLGELGAAFYTGNCHKWICAPKGAAFLHVRRDQQPKIRPLSISHGANSPRADRSRFLIEFGWGGTWDPSAYLSVPEALRVVGGLAEGGWPELMSRNRHLALAGRRILCRSLGVPLPSPDEMIGSLASIPLPPERTPGIVPTSPLYLDALQERLLAGHRIEVPIIPWPAAPNRLLRISAQRYNSEAQYRQLVEALREELGT